MDLASAVSLLIFLFTFWLLYRYFTEPYKYWERLGVPSAPAIPMIGSIYRIFSTPLHEFELENYRKYGRIHGSYELRSPVLNIGESKLIKDILLKDFQTFQGGRLFEPTDPIAAGMLLALHGKNWKRVRTIISPVFSSGKIKRMFDVIMESARTLARNFSAAAKKRESINIKTYYSAFTMDAIASSAFGTKIDSHNDPRNDFVKYARTIFAANPNWRFLLAAFAPSVLRFFGIHLFNPDTIKFFKKATLDIINDRKQTGNKRNDFLQLLMEAEHDDDAEMTAGDQNDDRERIKLEENASDENKDISPSNKHLSHDELVANCVLFFLAGYDTTASALSFVSYNLALHSEWQEKVIKEIDDSISGNQNQLTYDGIMQMKYLDMVIQETMRMYPPISRIERVAHFDYKLGDGKLLIPKGMVVGIPIYSIHHDPEYYPDPEKFDPERFNPEEKAKRDPFTYLPFGGGPRTCVAMRFALVEVKICLAFILSRFRFKESMQTKVPLDFNAGHAFLQPKEITVDVEERRDGCFESVT